DRFSISLSLNKYTEKEIVTILFNATKKIGVIYKIKALKVIASVSRLTPRIALNYLKRINDYSLIDNLKYVDSLYACKILKKIGINNLGLNELDIKYLNMLYHDYDNKPVGISTISSFLNENIKTIETMIERYLIEIGFIKKTSKGRVLTEKGITYINNYNK
nr:Holliday junction branch migration DNA helicase RuvB [Bacilli bacterium]